MDWNLQKDKFTYILRYYLPCLPQYGAEVTKKRGDDLLEFCKKNQVDAVMFFVDLNPYWYYASDTAEHNAYVASVIKPLSEKLRENGISYQLNYQNLLGSWDGNYDHSEMYDLERYVDDLGRESKASSCMLGKRFTAYAEKKLITWAKTKPDVIWLDDDFSLHNHLTYIHELWEGKPITPGLDFGCFCPTHLQMFNERFNHNALREDITASICSPDGDKSLRRDWLSFLASSHAEVCSWISKTVSDISPDIRLALMTSNPDVHAIEGRNWNLLLKSLCGTKTPLLRPGFGPYKESDPKSLLNAYRLARQLEENVSYSVAETCDMCPEIENTRFTAYSKSVAATSYQVKLSAFMGCGGVTLSLFDLDGAVLDEDPALGQMLSANKAYCDILTAAGTSDFSYEGICFLTSPDRFRTISAQKKVSRIYDLVPKRSVEECMIRTGVPFTYTTPEKIEEATCLLLDRYSVHLLTDKELLLSLSKCVFMDSGAAEEIARRGFAEHLGILPAEKIPYVAASENLHTQKHTDGSDVIVPSRINGNSWRRLQPNGSTVLSSLIIPSGEKYPGFTLFENTIGGKICVYAAEENFGDGFFTTYRVQFLRGLICSFAETVCADFTSYGSCVVKSKKNEQYVFIANLSADALENFFVHLPRTPKKVTLITGDGKSHVLHFAGNTCVIPQKLYLYESVVLHVLYHQ